jgi:hypothetical protein
MADDRRALIGEIRALLDVVTSRPVSTNRLDEQRDKLWDLLTDGTGFGVAPKFTSQSTRQNAALQNLYKRLAPGWFWFQQCPDAAVEFLRSTLQAFTPNSRKVGRPQIPASHVRLMRSLKRKGQTHKEVAAAVSVLLKTPYSKEAVRKQLSPSNKKRNQ